MSSETSGWNEQDARDKELLARGAINELLGHYVDGIRGRCRAKCGPHGDDVAQHVCLRLWQELTDGKHRGPKPFSVIVAGVVKFACQGWEGTTLGRDAPLEDWTLPATSEFIDDIADEVGARLDVEEFVKSLPPGDSEVARMKMLEYMDVDQIAEATGKKPNAIHQALHRIRREWKRWLES